MNTIGIIICITMMQASALYGSDKNIQHIHSKHSQHAQADLENIPLLSPIPTMPTTEVGLHNSDDSDNSSSFEQITPTSSVTSSQEGISIPDDIRQMYGRRPRSTSDGFEIMMLPSSLGTTPENPTATIYTPRFSDHISDVSANTSMQIPKPSLNSSTELNIATLSAPASRENLDSSNSNIDQAQNIINTYSLKKGILSIPEDHQSTPLEYAKNIVSILKDPSAFEYIINLMAIDLAHNDKEYDTYPQQIQLTPTDNSDKILVVTYAAYQMDLINKARSKAGIIKREDVHSSLPSSPDSQSTPSLRASRSTPILSRSHNSEIANPISLSSDKPNNFFTRHRTTSAILACALGCGVAYWAYTHWITQKDSSLISDTY